MQQSLASDCLTDLERIAIPRHARWDPIGLMSVRRYVRQRLDELGEVEEHRFVNGSDEGLNFILKLPGRNHWRRPLLIGANHDGPLHSVGADDNASGSGLPASTMGSPRPGMRSLGY